MKERCGGTYSEDWCLPVIRFIENGIGYRELQMAVMAAHTPLETVGYDAGQDHETKRDNDPRTEYRRALENFVNIARSQQQQQQQQQGRSQ